MKVLPSTLVTTCPLLSALAGTADGVEVVDVVEYELPFGWLGRVAHALLIRRQLDAIFGYRRGAVTAWFVDAESRRRARARDGVTSGGGIGR